MRPVSTWNYRVARIQHANGETSYGIIEQFYGDDGAPNGRSSPNDSAPYGDTVEDLRGDLELMMLALDAPVVDIELDSSGVIKPMSVVNPTTCPVGECGQVYDEDDLVAQVRHLTMRHPDVVAARRRESARWDGWVND